MKEIYKSYEKEFLLFLLINLSLGILMCSYLLFTKNNFENIENFFESNKLLITVVLCFSSLFSLISSKYITVRHIAYFNTIKRTVDQTGQVIKDKNENFEELTDKDYEEIEKAMGLTGMAMQESKYKLEPIIYLFIFSILCVLNIFVFLTNLNFSVLLVFFIFLLSIFIMAILSIVKYMYYNFTKIISDNKERLSILLVFFGTLISLIALFK